MNVAAEPQKRALVIGIDKYPELGGRYDLKGCVNDAELMAGVLRETFRFPAENVTLLRDAEATRDGILAALDALVASTAVGDVVVLHYSGHGSQMRDREGDEPDGFDETIVPHDSGRGARPNRDISDDEIYAWILRITKATPYVTLLFDCCHSGTITRDAFGTGARWVEPDLRPVEELPPSPMQAEATRGTSREAAGPSGWLPLGQRYVLIAGCRDEESSYEYAPKDASSDVTHGALSYFLTREMVKAGADTTYRDVFEAASVMVTAAQSRQHPQMEGAWDRRLFGVTDIEPMRFIRVQAREGSKVTLAAGAAHGAAQGSRWAVYPSGIKQVGPETAALGVVQVERVGAVTSDAEIVEEGEADAIQAGSRAVEQAHSYGDLRLSVELKAPHGYEDDVADVAAAIEASPLLRIAEPGEAAEARLYLLEARSETADGDPVPQLRMVEAPTWAVVGQDGRLSMPAHAVSESDVDLVLRENLEKATRYRQALALTNPNPAGALASKITFRLLRQSAHGEWVEAQPEEEGGHVRFAEGERIAGEVLNEHSAPVFVTVLDFGLTGGLSQLYPIRGAAEALAPGNSLRFGVREGDELELYMPDNFPYAPDPTDTKAAEGVESFKLFASTQETDFSSLLQEGYRAVDLGSPEGKSLLGDLLAMALTGHGHRDVRRNQVPPDQEWTTVTRAFVLAPSQPPGP